MVIHFITSKVGTMLMVLIGFMVTDYVTGLISAYIHNELSSKIGVKGLFRKVEYFLMVIVAIACDYAVYVMGNYDTHSMCAIVIIIWFMVNELLSIIENMAEIGVPVPDFIIVRLKEIKDKLNEGELNGNNF